MQLIVGGDRVVTVSSELAQSFQPGDSIVALPESGEVLHIPAEDARRARDAVSRAVQAFEQMSSVRDEQIRGFFVAFAARLRDPEVWAQVELANQRDVERARSVGRSTTRLEATREVRDRMAEGLLVWANAPSVRGKVLETVDRGSWRVELVGAELGAVAFVFEGRPNVVADATGVLRGGNTVVFRIGRDALGTAKALLAGCVLPALRENQLPEGAVNLVESASHAAAWALFRDTRLALAVARGSGPAVTTLGALARGAGVPQSLHGTGGAWLVVGPEVDPAVLEQNVFDSLDRKVCNTLNTCCLPVSAADALVPAFLRGLERAAARRGSSFKLHVTASARTHVPSHLFDKKVLVERADGAHLELQAEDIAANELGREWEWENSPEVTLTLVSSLDEATQLFNVQSPKFVACLLSESEAAHEHFYRNVNAPFVGDGFTRWVDGQYALGLPELGLANWEKGRLLGRGGILSGSSVYTIRTRVRGTGQGRPG